MFGMSHPATRRLWPLACLLYAALVAAVPAASAEDRSGAISPADPTVAKVGAKEIHLSDVMMVYLNLPEQYRKVSFEKLYPDLIDRVVERTVVANAARKAGFLQDSEVRRRLDDLEDRVLEDVYLRRTVQTDISEPMLQAKYAEILKNMPPPEDEVKARHILVDSEDKAKQVKAELDKGGDFAAAATKYSKDSSNAGGDLGWFARDQMVPEFAAAAFGAQTGAIVGPVKTQYGWHLIKVEGQRKRPAPSFAELKPELQELVLDDLIAARLRQLKATVPIQVYNADGSARPPAPSASGVAPAPAAPEPAPPAEPAPAPAR